MGVLFGVVGWSRRGSSPTLPRGTLHDHNELAVVPGVGSRLVGWAVRPGVTREAGHANSGRPRRHRPPHPRQLPRRSGRAGPAPARPLPAQARPRPRGRRHLPDPAEGRAAAAPALLAGVSSENAAHRAAVEWDEGGAVREGVYIWRRDTGSRLNALAGGRLFPGVHHHAAFDVEEADDRFGSPCAATTGSRPCRSRGACRDRLPAASVFGSVAEASAFFAAGSVGYSATADPARLQGLELRCRGWQVEPLEVAEVRSSFFDDRVAVPAGVDRVRLRPGDAGDRHEWHGLPDLCCGTSSAPRRSWTPTGRSRSR